MLRRLWQGGVCAVLAPPPPPVGLWGDTRGSRAERRERAPCADRAPRPLAGGSGGSHGFARDEKEPAQVRRSPSSWLCFAFAGSV